MFKFILISFHDSFHLLFIITQIFFEESLSAFSSVGNAVESSRDAICKILFLLKHYIVVRSIYFASEVLTLGLIYCYSHSGVFERFTRIDFFSRSLLCYLDIPVSN